MQSQHIVKKPRKNAVRPIHLPLNCSKIWTENEIEALKDTDTPVSNIFHPLCYNNDIIR